MSDQHNKQTEMQRKIWEEGCLKISEMIPSSTIVYIKLQLCLCAWWGMLIEQFLTTWDN